MICLRVSESSLIFFNISSQNLTWFCFWSSNKILGTILAHIFCIPRSCSKIVCTNSLFRLSSSNIIRTVNLRSVYTSCFTLIMFSFVLIVEGRPVLEYPPLPRGLFQNVCVIQRLASSTSHIHHKLL